MEKPASIKFVRQVCKLETQKVDDVIDIRRQSAGGLSSLERASVFIFWDLHLIGTVGNLLHPEFIES